MARGVIRRHKNSREEYYRRDGRWERVFSVKGESWPMIEHWAAEAGFHLVAIKGKRRMYEYGYNTALFVTNLEVRHEEFYVYVSCWIEVGWLARLFTLYQYPSEFHLKPGGFLGLIKRRRTSHSINNLLYRFKQTPIQGTAGFHIADLDLSTLALMGTFAVPLSYFFGASGRLLEMAPGLSRDLLGTVSRPSSVLAICALVLVLMHHWFTVRAFTQRWVRWTSFSILSLGFGIASLFALSHVRNEMAENKMLYHCVEHFESAPCNKVLDSLNSRERDYTLTRLQTLADELVVRENKKTSGHR